MVNNALGIAGRLGGGGAALRLLLWSGVEVLMLLVPCALSNLGEILKSGVEAEMPSFFIGLKLCSAPLGSSLEGFFGSVDDFVAYGNGISGSFFLVIPPLEFLLRAVRTVPLACGGLGKS